MKVPLKKILLIASYKRFFCTQVAHYHETIFRDTGVFIALTVVSMYVHAIHLRHAPIIDFPGARALHYLILATWMEQKSMQWAKQKKKGKLSVSTLKQSLR